MYASTRVIESQAKERRGDWGPGRKRRRQKGSSEDERANSKHSPLVLCWDGRPGGKRRGRVEGSVEAGRKDSWTKGGEVGGMRFWNRLASDSKADFFTMTRGKGETARKKRRRAGAGMERRILCFRFALFVKFGNDLAVFFFLS
ncbi:hypothetical protein BDW62DRAFT_188394 [Aspergillus aurantiobrunneus]